VQVEHQEGDGDSKDAVAEGEQAIDADLARFSLLGNIHHPISPLDSYCSSISSCCRRRHPSSR